MMHLGPPGPGLAPLPLAAAVSRPVAQQPEWLDPSDVRAVRDVLRTAPPPVLPAEADRLTARLAEVAHGSAFVLQGGTAPRPSPATPMRIRAGTSTSRPAWSPSSGARADCRWSGRPGWPDSTPSPAPSRWTPTGCPPTAVTWPTAALPPRRNGHPARMLRAHAASAVAMNFVRTRGDDDVFTGHEALVLEYECALLRPGPPDGRRLYRGSAHFLWIGERTRRIDGAHIGYAALLGNPVGVKLGPTTTPE